MPVGPDSSSAGRGDRDGVCPCAHCGLPVGGASHGEIAFCCGGCRLVHGLLSTKRADQTISSAMLRIGLGIFFAMNLMVFSFCFYGVDTLGGGEELTQADAALDGLFRWLLLLLGSGVMLTLWVPLAQGAWLDLQHRRLQAGLLIALGALAAYLVSAISVVRGVGAMYFDSASMILLLVTVGQYLEAQMKTAAVRRAEGQLLQLPDEATIETAEGDRVLQVNEIAIGQIVRVGAGSVMPVDGEVVRGGAEIDEAMLWGESEPQLRRPGAMVYAGSIVLQGVVWVRVVWSASDRRIELIVDQLRALRHEPTQFQRLADRMATVFIPATLVLGVAVFVSQWWVYGAPMEGVMRALAVALIACPCALGLTAPLVVSRLTSTLVQRGIIVRSAKSLELAGLVRHLFFDKTGTLTTGRFAIERIVRLDPVVESLSIGAALQRGSTHPIARAWDEVNAPIPEVEYIEPANGLGVYGVIDGQRWFVGRAEADDAIPDELAGLASVVLKCDGEIAAWFGLRESVRPESSAVIDELKSMHIRAEVLTGDSPTRGAALGLALDVHVTSAMTPEMKREAIRESRVESNAPVAFVGDGINDALALAEADLGVTVAGGSDLAHASGQVSLLDGDLRRLIVLLRAGRVARGRIALALGWSFAYNSVGLTLAALGLLTPVFAAIAMVLSSAVTIGIASRSAEHALDRHSAGDGELPGDQLQQGSESDDAARSAPVRAESEGAVTA